MAIGLFTVFDKGPSIIAGVGAIYLMYKCLYGRKTVTQPEVAIPTVPVAPVLTPAKSGLELQPIGADTPTLKPQPQLAPMPLAARAPVAPNPLTSTPQPPPPAVAPKPLTSTPQPPPPAVRTPHSATAVYKGPPCPIAYAANSCYLAAVTQAFLLKYPGVEEQLQARCQEPRNRAAAAQILRYIEVCKEARGKGTTVSAQEVDKMREALTKTPTPILQQNEWTRQQDAANTIQQLCEFIFPEDYRMMCEHRPTKGPIGKKYYTPRYLLELGLPIDPKRQNLQSILQSEFVTDEEHITLEIVPPFLIVQLNRNRDNRQYISDPIALQDPFFTIPGTLLQDGQAAQYRLVASIRHGGNMRGGHYTACVDGRDGKYYFTNDLGAIVKEIKPAEFLSQSAHSCLLFFERIG